uniref:DUF19 domain-containing protein n=1 Tax=Rhabditophanes sp. KR3021 TaxID=114890 RepID=A0AC35UFV1_9BILA
MIVCLFVFAGSLVVVGCERFFERETDIAAATCDKDKFFSGLGSFIVDAGLTGASSAPPSSGQEFKLSVEGRLIDAYHKDPASIEAVYYQLCTAQKGFYKTLGINNIIGCINTIGLIGLDFLAEDAYLYEQVLSSLNYQCGPTFRVFISNINSLGLVITNNSVDIMNCLATFDAATTAAQNDADTCNALDAYAYCYGKLFFAQSKQQDFGYANCQKELIGMLPRFGQCYSPNYECDLSKFV